MAVLLKMTYRALERTCYARPCNPPEVCTVVQGMNNERELNENVKLVNILENIVNDSAVDIPYFAKRAIRENFQ